MSLRRLGLLLALPTMVGLSLAACGTEDDAAPGPGPSGGSGATAGSGGSGETGGTSGSGATGGNLPEAGVGGEPGPGPGGAGGDSSAGAGGDSAAGAGGDSAAGAGGDGNYAGSGGEGGEGVAPCHVVIQNFSSDPGAGMGLYIGSQTGPVKDDSSVTYSSTEGAAATGSGKLFAKLSAYGQFAQLGLFLPSNTVWTCKSKLHAMVKLQSATDLTHLTGIEFSLSSNNYAIYTPQLNSTTGFAMNTWTPIVLNFATATPAPKFDSVSGIGFQLKTVAAGTVPVDTTLFVDDVWLE